MATSVVALVVAVLGVVLGLIVTIYHRSLPPAGLIVGLALITGWGAGLRLIGRGRLFAFTGLLGVLLAQLLLSAGIGGSFVVVVGPLGYALTLGSVLVALVVLAWPELPARSRYDGTAESRKGLNA